MGFRVGINHLSNDNPSIFMRRPLDGVIGDVKPSETRSVSDAEDWSFKARIEGA
jgi:hypothetical protein